MIATCGFVRNDIDIVGDQVVCARRGSTGGNWGWYDVWGVANIFAFGAYDGTAVVVVADDCVGIAVGDGRRAVAHSIDPTI